MIIKRKSTLFTLLIAMYPIFSIYATGIPNLSVADFLLVFSTIVLCIKNGKKALFISKNVKWIAVFFVYIFISSIFQILLSTGISMISTIRYLVYLVNIIVLNPYFDFEKGIKILRILTLIMALYVIMQFIAQTIFSIVLPWYIPGLPVIDEGFKEAISSPYYLKYHRPTGFFYEPTHYSQFSIMYLSFLLFDDIYEEKNRWAQIVLISFSILCSGSSAGLALIGVAFLLYYIENSLKKRTFMRSILILLFLILIIILVVNIPFFNTIVTRVIGENGDFTGAAMGYRFDSVDTIFNGRKSIIELLFGSGRGSENAYFTGIFYILNAQGFCGLILYIIIMVNLFRIAKTSFQKNFLIIIFVGSIGSEYICNFGILSYLMYIISMNNFIKKDYHKIRIKK